MFSLYESGEVQNAAIAACHQCLTRENMTCARSTVIKTVTKLLCTPDFNIYFSKEQKKIKKKKITFYTEGLVLKKGLFLPEKSSTPVPGLYEKLQLSYVYLNGAELQY